MSAPSILIFPESTKKEPATAFSSVDFPDPFDPMIMTNDLSSTSSPTPRSACSSFGVPALNVLLTPAISSMGSLRRHFLANLPHPIQQRGRDQREKHENCRRQL